MSKKKRKVFDSSKQRAQDLQVSVPKNPSSNSQERDFKLARIQERKHQWRQKHEEFISAIRAAKDYTIAKKTGAPLPPPPASSVNPDLIQCKWCLRRFNEKAADRHIKFCEEKHRKVTQPPAKKGQIVAARPSITNPTRSGDTHDEFLVSNNRKPSNTTPPDMGIRNHSSSNSRISRGGSYAMNGPRGIPQPTGYGRTASNHAARPTREKLPNPDNLHTKSSPSPTFGCDEVPINCPRSLASGKARYVPLIRPTNAKQRFLKQPVVSPPGRLHIHKPISPSGQTTHFDNRARLKGTYSPHGVDSGDDHDTRMIPRRRNFPCSGRKSPLVRRSSPSSLNVFCVTDSGSTVLGRSEYQVSTKECPGLNKRYGPVLRSGRTHEDYVNARELARDLVGEQARILKRQGHYPIGTAHIDPITSTEPLIDYNYRSSLDNDQSDVTTTTSKQSDVTQTSTTAVSLVCSGKKNPYVASTADVHVELDQSSGMISYAQPTSNRPNTMTNRPNRTTDGVKSGTITAKSDGKNNKFCFECGSQFPNTAAKFCPECGVRRMAV
ncbi:hypothetical protein P879_04291 [Paragonimus westermani]|uniref:C2HC/C3H-type domain-containing protein n=1 Tax=Paragonimus westermani TaxID=34504 RepID=A0A8T0DC39_9TREM|nr:hypothetical protein P879_04291 [Paragonimus westermani]